MIKSWSDEAWEDFEYWTKQSVNSSFLRTFYPSSIERIDLIQLHDYYTITYDYLIY